MIGRNIVRALLFAFSSACMALVSAVFATQAIDAIQSGELFVGLSNTRSASSGYIWSKTFTYSSQPTYFILHLLGVLSGAVACVALASLLIAFAVREAKGTAGWSRFESSLLSATCVSAVTWLIFYAVLHILFALHLIE